MRQVRKEKVSGYASELHACMIIDGKEQWRAVYCPLSASPEGEHCCEWCAWYDEEPVSVKLNDRLSASSGRVVATCKGTPIGEIIEAP